jgi:uncharacterized protein YlxW (UPF0749 family)
MSRFSALRWGILLLLVLAASCGEEKKTPPGPDPLELQMQKVRQQKANLQSQTAQLKERINAVSAHVADDQRRLEERIREMDQIQENLVALTLAAESFDTSRKELDQTEAVSVRKEQAKGWHWSIYLILVIVIVVIVALFRNLSRDDELDDETLSDESYTEENDLGTIRYPGKSGDSGTKRTD